MPTFAGSLSRYPARALFAWYLGLIVIGSLALQLPWCRAEGAVAIEPLDAIFTATSAACVTGLSVRSTGDFSILGQFLLLVMIQLGGLGIMTVSSFLILSLTGRETLRQKAVVSETLGAKPADNLRNVLGLVVYATLAFEGIGIVLLSLSLPWEYRLDQRLGYAIFHSISAFCNAGFALPVDGMVPFRNNVGVNLTICGLVIVGGIGVPILLDVRRVWGEKRKSLRDSWDRLHVHTKLSLIGTFGLLAWGTVMFVILEHNNALAQMSWKESLLVSFFQSTAARTAGFNTVDIGNLTDAMLFVTILLMMVGACPGSTGGGYKVSTFMVLLAHSWSRLRGEPRIRMFRRTISPETVGRAIAVVLLYVFIGTVGIGLLLVAEQSESGFVHDGSHELFLDAVFEVFSALGTVGLSAGLTPNLSAASKWLIILLMFVGRLGPVSVIVVLSREPRDTRIEYPKEDVLIG